MKKLFVRKAVAILSAVIAVCTIVSCSGEDNILKEFMPSDESTHYDLNGYDFIINNYTEPVYGESTVGDSILQRYDDLEKNMNITINFVECASDAWLGIISADYAAGLKYCDISQNFNEFVYEGFKAGVLIELDTLEGFDVWNGNFGSEAMLEAVRFNDGHIYGFQAENWPERPGFGLMGFILFNNDLIREYNLTSPHEYLENGTWVWDTFRTMAKAATDEASDRYGIASDSETLVPGAIYSNGGSLIRYNETTGKYVYNFTAPEAIEAVEWLRAMKKDDRSMILNNENLAFAEGRALFMADDDGYAFSQGTAESPLTNLINGFGWVPFPFGPKNTEQKWTAKTAQYASYFNIPDNLDFDAGIVVPIINEMFKPIEGTLPWREYYKKYMISDEKSAEIFIKLLDESETSYMHIFGRVKRVSAIVSTENMLLSDMQSVNEALQKSANTIQELIDEAFDQ